MIRADLLINLWINTSDRVYFVGCLVVPELANSFHHLGQTIHLWEGVCARNDGKQEREQLQYFFH